MNKNRLIYEIRRRLNISQAELGRLLGVSASAVSYYENNRKFPSPQVSLTLIGLGRQLGLPVDIEDIYQSLACQPNEPESTK